MGQDGLWVSDAWIAAISPQPQPLSSVPSRGQISPDPLRTLDLQLPGLTLLGLPWS